MKIYINNDVYDINSATTLKKFIENLDWINASCAIAVNKSFVSRDSYEKYILQDQDHVDVVSPMQGG